MATVLLSPSPILQFFNNSGQPNAGGSLLTQVGGVNYPTYQDSAGTIPLPNPIPLNARGEVSNSSGTSVQLFLTSGVTYTFTLYDANNNQLNQSTYVVPPVTTTSPTAITYNEGGTGAVNRTVQSKLQETISVKDFGAIGNGIANDYNSFVNAIYSISSSGGTLYIPAGTYYLGVSGILISRSNINIVGDGMPEVASNKNNLIGGTILQGQVVIDGNNISVSNLGVDCGNTFVSTYNSNNGLNGLVIHNVAQTGTLNQNTNVQNVVGLVKIPTTISDPTAAVHGVLLESLQYLNASNIYGVGGWFGVVVKASDANLNNLYSDSNDTIGVQLKSDTYAPVANVNISNVYATNTSAPRMYEGFAIISEATQLHNVNATNICVDNAWNAVRIDCSQNNPGYAITLNNVSVTNSQNGIDVRGPAYAVVIDNSTVWEPTTGYGFTVSGDPVGNQYPETVAVSNLRVAINESTSTGGVNVSGIVNPSHILLNNINVADAGGALGAKSTININSNVTLGQTYGTILGQGLSPSLLNGWAVTYTGQSFGAIVKSGWTSGYGRISATSATSDTFLQLPTGYYPDNLIFFTSMTGFNGSTGELVPVTVQIGPTGQCSVYPNRAAYSSIAWFNLTDLKFPSEIPAQGSI